MAATVGAEMWLTLSSSQLVYTCTNISCNQPPTTTPSTAPSSQGTFSSTNASHASFPVDMGPSKYPGNLVPSGAIPQWLPKRQIIREIRNKRPLLDYLLPICLKLEFKLVITPEISIELRPGNEVKEVRVKAHLSRLSHCSKITSNSISTLSRVTGSRKGTIPL
jgi:hypothetical protein